MSASSSSSGVRSVFGSYKDAPVWRCRLLLRKIAINSIWHTCVH